MVFGGIQKSTLIDYPGKVSCVLFFSGCNFHCPFCHNPELAKGTALEQWPEQAAFDFLEKRKGFLEGVVISGGEPCLHPDVIRVCRTIWQMGYSIKLDTNGSCPNVLEKLISGGLVDYVAMDIKTVPELYPQYIQKDCNTDAITSSIGLIKASGLSHEFRTTCIRPLIDKHIVRSICGMIQGADLYVLQRFRLSRVLNPEFFKAHDYRITENDLLEYRAIAEKWVTSCRIR
ncbi:MAG: anaerobic ribonucleoside-triphosphate reductase activating protein [Deltaproteobacteria bacterium]|nr:anaerobic ribonucleoside-triphosphate reductase activating protein [Deltaproteobacteria bacterium]